MHQASRPIANSAATAMTVVPGRDPPARRAADSAETARCLTEDHRWIAPGINDIAVDRLFTVGVALQTALGLMNGHSAAGTIQHAITELDQAITDIRDTAFGTRQTGFPGGGTPG